MTGCQMLTDRQIDTFKRDGIIVFRRFFTLAETSQWREQVFDYFGRPETAGRWREALATRKGDDFRLTPDPTPGSHARLSRIYKALNARLEWTGHNQLVVRAGEDPAEWLGPRIAHIDIPLYAPLRTLANNVIYLSKVQKRGGAFMYWPGSHRVAWDYFRQSPEDYLAQGARSHNQVFQCLVDRMPSAPVEFVGMPGDLLIWHALTLHAASINKRREERLAVFGRWGVAFGSGECHDFSGDMWSHWKLQKGGCDDSH
jgi:hypothetical protein